MSRTRVIRQPEVNRVEWEIPNFLSFFHESRSWLKSDDFLFAGESWCLKIWVEGYDKDNETFVLDLVRYEADTRCSVHFSVGLKKDDGQIEKWTEDKTDTLEEVHVGFCCASFPRKEFQRRMSELLPSGTLTIVVTLRKQDAPTQVRTIYLVCSSDRSVSSVEATTQTQSENCIEKLLDDFEHLMTSGHESDFTVNVQGEEFHLHKNILGARSPVFRSMLQHEMKEKTEGQVCIDDCEPDTFRAFVRYVYSGRTDELSTDTVFRLYALADKHQVDDLKSACVNFIQKTLSVDTFCDVVSLSLTYDLKDLLEKATTYFAENTKAIIQTVKWMNFMTKNPIQANELHLKTLK